MRLFTRSIESLLQHEDYEGLVQRLDAKDMGAAWIALTVAGAPAVPALVSALGTERGAAACGVLAEIGAPALPALVATIASGDESKAIEAGAAISAMRERGVPLSDELAERLAPFKAGGAGVANGRHVAALTALGLLRVEEGGKLVLETGEGELPRTLRGHGSYVSDCAVSPDGTWIVSASGDGTLKVWDAPGGECVRTLTGHTGGVRACAVSADGTQIVSASDDGTIKVWSAADGACLRTLGGHTGSVDTCAISPDGTWIVSGSEDATVKIWDAQTGACRHTLTGHTGAVLGCAVAPDGTWLLSVGSDTTMSRRFGTVKPGGTIKVWDAATGECIRTFEPQPAPVTSCAIAPDGTWVVTTNPPVTIWDPVTGTCLRTLSGHTGPIYDCAVSNRGGWIVSGGGDKTAKLWDAASGECLRTFSGHLGPVYGCAVSPDGTYVVSVTGETLGNDVKVWDTRELAERARRSAARTERARWLADTGLFESTVPCSECGKPMLQEPVKTQVDVWMGYGLFGNVCLPCGKVYCDECIRVGAPTPCPTCGTPTQPAGRDDLARIGITLSDTPAPAPTGAETVVDVRGATVPDVQYPVLELRPDDEIARAEQAGHPLGTEDEALAHEMRRLMDEADRFYGQNEVGYEAVCEQMRLIGERLCDNGGNERMQLVAYRVQALGGRVRDCEQHWSGICGWQV